MHFSTSLSKQRAKNPKSKVLLNLAAEAPKALAVIEDTASYWNLLLRCPAGSRTLLRVIKH